jgi:nucleotide-binding universal stress UspA family protein
MKLTAFYRVRADWRLDSRVEATLILLRRFNAALNKLRVSNRGPEYLMIRMLIPVLDSRGAVEAARYAVFMYLEHGVTEVELLEVLEPVDQGRIAAFHTRSSLMRLEKHAMLKALIDVRAILEEAGVPYHWKRVFGHRTQAITDYAAKTRPDVMVIDTSHMGFFRRLAILASLARRTVTPVTMVH